MFDVRQVLSLLDESDDGESGSDVELAQFDVSNSESESSGSDRDVVTQLPTLSTSANPAPPTLTAAVPITVSKGKAASKTKKGLDTTWVTVNDMVQDKPPAIVNFAGVGGAVHLMPADTLPVSYFDRFFLGEDANEPTLWDFLVLETNKYQQR